MSKNEIEVEGLPNDVIPIALRKPKSNKEFIFCLDTGCVVKADHRIPKVQLIVKKKQPRRIVLEETEEKIGDLCQQHFVRTDGSIADFRIISENKWREVKETEEPKLCLSVEECEEIVYNDYSIPVDLSVKIDNFLSASNKTS